MAIVLMVQMIFQLFVPVTYAKSVRDTTQLVPVLTVNGQTVNLDDVVELRPGDEVSLQVDYSNKLSDNGLKPGDVLYFKLPKVFENLTLNTENLRHHFSEIKIENNEIRLVAGEHITTAIEGMLQISATVGTIEYEQNEDFVIDIAGSKVDVEVVMKPEQAIDRVIDKKVNGSDGEYEIPANSTGSIIGQIVPYSVMINEKYLLMENAQFIDAIPAGMEIVEDSLKVQKMEDGTLVDVEVNITSYNPLMLDLGTIKEPYKISYDLKVVEDKESYINEATINSTNQPSSTDQAIAKPPMNWPTGDRYLVKYLSSHQSHLTPDVNGSVVGQVIDYEIKVNEAKEHLNGVTFKDRIPDGMQLVSGSIQILKEERGVTTDVTAEFLSQITTEGQLFEIDFGNISTQYTIKYQTEIIEDKPSYNNKAELDWEGNHAESEVPVTPNYTKPGQGNVSKSITSGQLKPDENDSVIGQKLTYSIMVNNELTEKVDLKLVDQMPDGMKLDVNSIKIYHEVGQGQFVEVTDQFMIHATEELLEIDFGTTDQRYKVEYVTEITKDLESYTNVADVTWGSNGEQDSSSSTTKPSEPGLGPMEGEDVIKKINYWGEHDEFELQPDYQGYYVGQTIDYKITVNENYEEKKQTVLTDYLPAGMSYVEGSLKVTKIDRYWQWSDVTEDFTDKLTVTDGVLSLDFGNIRDKYIVEYKLKITSYQAEGWRNNAELVWSEGSAEDDTLLKPTQPETIIPMISKKVSGNDLIEQYPNWDSESLIGNTYQFTIEINEKSLDLTKVKLEDFIPDGMELTGEIKVEKKIHEPWHSYFTDVTSEFQSKIKVEGQKLTIDFGDISTAYKVTYSLKVTEAQELYDNKATVSWGEGNNQSDNAVVKPYQPQPGEYSELHKTVNGKDEITIVPDHNYLNTTLNYQLIVNDLLESKHNVVVSDQLPEGLILNQNSLKIEKVFGNNQVKDVTWEFRNNQKITTTEKSFTIDFGDINTRYYVSYTAQITEEKDVFVNTATLEATNQSTESAHAKVEIDWEATKPTDEDILIEKTSLQDHISQVGDKVKYKIKINEEHRRLLNLHVTDVIPQGMKLDVDSLKVTEVVNEYYQKDITQELKNQSKIQASESQFEIDLFDGYSMYVIEYECVVTELENNYQNSAQLSGESFKRVVKNQLNFESMSGTLNANKIVDRSAITSEESQEVVYSIIVWNSMDIASEYIKISDPLDPRVKFLGVEGSDESFTVEYDEATHTVTAYNHDILTPVNYEQARAVKIRVSFEDVEGGETVRNTAKINDSNRHVDVKKGYKFEAEKIGSDTGQPLQGAEFKVINEDGEIIIPSLISNEEGKLSGEIPQPGTYYLVETKAPNGYQLLKDQISFEILESTIGQTISIGTIENHPKGEEPNTGSLEITKIDLGSKELLSGAIFEIKNLAGEVVQRGETKDGYLTFENLPYGSYTYQEVQAPPGYHLDSTVYPFEINEMTSNIQVTVTNRKNNIFDQLPETGGMGTTIFTMVGGSLLLGGAVIQERNKRKKISK